MKTTKLILLILHTLLLSSCSKEEVFITKKSPNKEIQSFTVRSNMTPILTLQDVQNCEGALESIPPHHNLTMEGQWDYSEAYLYTEYNGKLFEIYVFNNSNDLEFARTSCDKNYYEKNNKMCCDGEGNGCSVVHTTTGVEINTCPVQ